MLKEIGFVAVLLASSLSFSHDETPEVSMGQSVSASALHSSSASVEAPVEASVATSELTSELATEPFEPIGADVSTHYPSDDLFLDLADAQASRSVASHRK